MKIMEKYLLNSMQAFYLIMLILGYFYDYPVEAVFFVFIFVHLMEMGFFVLIRNKGKRDFSELFASLVVVVFLMVWMALQVLVFSGVVA